MQKQERWDGGYIHIQKDGRPLYIIQRRFGGKRYHISTRSHTETAAYAQLRRFEADPIAYAEEMAGNGRSTTEPLRMTREMVLEFRGWCINRDEPAPTTARYANECAHRLFDWLEDFGKRDLRALTLPTLKELLARRGGQKARIIALKAFFSWLRTEKCLIERRQDATLDLKVPQAIPEKHRRRKAVEAAHVRAALKHLTPPYRDCLRLMAATGWHVTELERFVRDPNSRIAQGRGRVLGVLQVLHKTGQTTRTPITDAEVLEAAERLRERAQVPRWLNTALKAACRRAKVPEFTFGVLRHSVATWAVQAGTHPDVVAQFLGHASKSTLLRFYADVAVPTSTVRLPRF